MEIVDFTPLGFSDLADDEAFVASVFRCWQFGDAMHKDAETRLAEVLESDRLYNGFKSLFYLFGWLPIQYSSRTKKESVVLTLVEESSLKGISYAEIKQSAV